MDDFYLIHSDKATLQAARDFISRHLAARGLKLNNKTQIFPLRNGIDFLGFHTYLTDSGKVIRKVRKRSRDHMRRKLKKYAIMIDNGAMTVEKATESYQSWRAHAAHGNCRGLVEKFDTLFSELIERSEDDNATVNNEPACWGEG